MLIDGHQVMVGYLNEDGFLYIVEKLPILGSWKLDLVALKALAKSLMEA